MLTSQRTDSEITSAWSALTEYKNVVMPFETNVCKTQSAGKKIISFVVAADFPNYFDILIRRLSPEICLSDTALLFAA